MSRDLTVDEIIAILSETPDRIGGLTDGLSPAELRAAPVPGAWSISDVLAHLRACGDVFGGNTLRILREDRPAWKGMNPRAWLKKTDYPTWEFGPAFEAYKRQRTELLTALDGLPPEAWQRTATVTGMIGETYERSALYYAIWLAGHERTHWRQIGHSVAALGTQVAT